MKSQPTTILSEKLVPKLACPFCKDALSRTAGLFSCESCGQSFPEEARRNGPVYDFRIRRPASAETSAATRWKKFQVIYEDVVKDRDTGSGYQKYLAEIESVRKIYEIEFRLTGSVLDVGGYRGLVRHFLGQHECEEYVSVDPYIESFDHADQEALTMAYPCLEQPCNFLACHAEHLPFAKNSFDWVHMRSVVDHLADPFFSFKEAYRVLKPGGRIMIGLAIHEKMKGRKISLMQRMLQKIKHDGFFPTLRTAFKKVTTDDHNVRVSQDRLIEWLEAAGFKIENQYWQEPPYDYCLYMSAFKTEPWPKR